MTESSSTSFPFLKIAHDHNVPYSVVIRLAEAGPSLWSDLDSQTRGDYHKYSSPELLQEISTALIAERKRRLQLQDIVTQVTHVRRLGDPGGTTFPYLAARATNLIDTIVYANNMAHAVTVYQEHFLHEPFAIRQMSDNE